MEPWWIDSCRVQYGIDADVKNGDDDQACQHGANAA
jgi:hypothetical protein